MWSLCDTGQLHQLPERHPIRSHALVYFQFACVVPEPIVSTVASPSLAWGLTLSSGKLLANLGINQRLRRPVEALHGETSLSIRMQTLLDLFGDG